MPFFFFFFFDSLLNVLALTLEVGAGSMHRLRDPLCYVSGIVLHSHLG
jgi:hypothetical protein